MAGFRNGAGLPGHQAVPNGAGQPAVLQRWLRLGVTGEIRFPAALQQRVSIAREAALGRR